MQIKPIKINQKMFLCKWWMPWGECLFRAENDFLMFCTFEGSYVSSALYVSTHTHTQTKSYSWNIYKYKSKVESRPIFYFYFLSFLAQVFTRGFNILQIKYLLKCIFWPKSKKKDSSIYEACEWKHKFVSFRPQVLREE